MLHANRTSAGAISLALGDLKRWGVVTQTWQPGFAEASFIYSKLMCGRWFHEWSASGNLKATIGFRRVEPEVILKVANSRDAQNPHFVFGIDQRLTPENQTRLAKLDPGRDRDRRTSLTNPTRSRTQITI